MDRYSLDAVVVDKAGGTSPDFTIGGIKNQQLSLGLQHVIESGGGSVDPTFMAVTGQSPLLSFDTLHIATLLGNVGISGYNFAEDIDEPGVVFYFKKRALGGIFAAGAVHDSLTMANGLMAWNNISAQHRGGPAVASVVVYPIWDGTNAPLAIATSKAIATAASVSESFRLGSCYFNGTEIEGVMSLDISLGLDIRTEGDGGQQYDDHVGIYARNPAITITSKDVHLLQSLITVGGLAQSDTDSIVYLCNNGSGDDISFSIDDGRAFFTTVDLPHQDDAVGQLTIQPIHDLTNDIFVIDTAATNP